jgi:glycosyltransferase involved in cell wall biosynthesis
LIHDIRVPVRHPVPSRPGAPRRAARQRARSAEVALRHGLPVGLERTTIDVSLIIPAHNEATRLPETLRRYAEALQARHGDRLEILVVANGCTDATAAVARGMAGAVPGLRVLDIPEPIGKGGAVLAGLDAARGSAAIFADADGATDPASLLDLIDGLRDADVVIGTRHAASSVILRQQPLRRRLFSRVFNIAARLLFGIPFRDTQCGAKAFRSTAARLLVPAVQERAWTFDLDLLLTARRLGLSVTERAVTWSDIAGSQLKAAGAAPEILRSLWRLWRRERTAANAENRPVADRPSAPVPPDRILAFNWRCPRHPEAGGAELNLFEQARRWVEQGHPVTVVAARNAGDIHLPPLEIIDGVTVRRMGGRFTVYPLAAWYLLTHGRDHDRVLDVANGIPFFAPLFTRLPVTLLVHHVHDRQWFEEFPRLLGSAGWLIERFVVPLVYRRTPVIAVSPTTRDALVRTGFASEQVQVIFNGVAAPILELPEASRPTIAYVGRIKRYKRLDRLVRAFADLLPRFPEARLVIAGDGDARSGLESLVDELELRDAVDLPGFVSERAKARILGRAHVFATPSMHEGWGLSVIEANQHGTPAVAYDVPGLRVAIRHGETGLLATDDRTFRDALATLLGDDEMRGQYSLAARRWAGRFDWDTTAQETLAVLQSKRPTERPRELTAISG